MRRYIIVILLLFSVGAAIGELSATARQVYSINRNWRFFSHSEENSDNALLVNLPHIWNNDALSGRKDYFRGTGNYIREIDIPRHWRGKRVFIRSYGANSIATVMINGQHVGEHRGGYTTFVFDITQYLKFGEKNNFWIMVNNSPQMDVLPISGDANVYGGLFRDLELIVTGREVVSLTDHGSDGVYVVQKNITEHSAELEVRLMVNGVEDKVVNAEVTLFTPELDTVATRTARIRLNGRTTSTAVMPLSIEKPHLWQGKEDPFLYSLGVKILSDGRVSDSLVVRTGLRTVGYDNENNQLLLNGKPSPIKGVIVTQDRAMMGTALTNYQVWEDFKLILDMGANAVRIMGVAHHPAFYRLCDRFGILVFSDFPLLGPAYLTDKSFVDTEPFRSNAKIQAREIVMQQFNNPSVVVWNIFSNLHTRGDNPTEFISTLNMAVKRESPSRLTAASSNEDGKINFITDLVIWDHHFGWREGLPSDIAIWAKQLTQEWSKLKSAVSYSAGGSIYHQEDKLSRPDYMGNWHPERWQTHLHETYLKYLSSDNQFWGVFVGNMFDYGAAIRSWGEGKGLNDSGLVTFDRKYCKDAYYLYKAHWNKDEPMLYIAESRWSVRQSAQQAFKVYSNQSEVELFVNGESQGVRKGSEAIFMWELVHLKRGFNHIKAVSGELVDHIVIEVSDSKIDLS